MEKKGYALSDLNMRLLAVNAIAFIGTLALFIKAMYLPAMCCFVFFAVTAIAFAISIYDGATEFLTDVTVDLEDAREHIQKHESIDDTFIGVSQEKEKLELELISHKETIENLEKDASDKDRIIAELKTQLDFKNKELSECTENATDERTSLLKKSLLPNPENSRAEMLNIIDLAKETANEILGYASKAGIDIKFNSNDDKLLVKADKQRLSIMFKNIMDNSVKYMGKNGQLVITISAVEDIIFIVLKDNGNGLASEEVSHIFELNYQGSNRISGNGLGLTQAKAIVEYYGGNIYAKSSMNSGMAIYIQLPAN